MALGLTWFTMGMFKKVIIADQIAPVADAFFAHPHGANAASAWLGVLTYSLQLYFDFSGYSDMAVGIARMFSLRFPLNFNSPYKASSIIDYWQRWHMTLTRFIMDYIYAPIQFHISRSRLDKGKKVSKKATATLEGFTQMVAIPTLITMFLVGIWHGAGKQFLFFGLLHGIYITINHAWRIFVPAGSPLKKIVNGPFSVALTYLASLTGAVFSAPTLFATHWRHSSTLRAETASATYGLSARYSSSPHFYPSSGSSPIPRRSSARPRRTTHRTGA